MNDPVGETVVKVQVNIIAHEFIERLLGNLRLRSVDFLDRFHDLFACFHLILELVVVTKESCRKLMNQHERMQTHESIFTTHK